ncbi:4'-phosphopantetheinyl transferase family protein [Lysobacter tyrosinilyticus]
MLQTNTNQGIASQWRRVLLREAFESALPAPEWLAQPAISVHVALFDLHDWWPWLPDAYALLDMGELRRVHGRRLTVDRDQLALGYSLHRMLLAKVLGRDASEVAIGRDMKGCPRLSGSSLSTSLSHADHCVAVAVATEGPVGVDIELTEHAPVVPEIAGRICHSSDTGIVALPGLARNEALLALWVRKQAYLKAAGIGPQRETPTFAAVDGALVALPWGGSVRVQMLDADHPWTVAVASAPQLPVLSAQLRPYATALGSEHD